MTIKKITKKLGVVQPEVRETGNVENPWVATSVDNLNVAYGQTKEGALANLEKGIKSRIERNG